MLFQGLSFAIFFIISGLIPIAIILSGIQGKIDWFLSISLFILAYDVCQWLLVLRFAEGRWNRSRQGVEWSSPPTITVIIPAWNEESTLVPTLTTVLNQDDSPDAIIISDDGSTDNTISWLSANYELTFQGTLGISQRYPNLRVLHKEHSGKGDSINQAMELSDTDVVLILDADTRLHPGSIRALRETFVRYPDVQVVSGTVIPSCAPSRLGRILQFFQQHEYARLHLWRLAWSHLNSSLIVSGACSAFRRQTLLDIGGFYPASWVEDYEVMYRLQRFKRLRQETCRVMVQPSLCVQTDAPHTLYSFLRQRRRWAGGFLETMIHYRQMVGDRHYGILGCGYLLHNAFSIIHPFYNLAWLMAGIALSLRGSQIYIELLLLLLVSLVLGAVIIYITIRRYRRYFCRQEVSSVGAVIELIVRPFFYIHLLTLSYGWGYISYLRRQKSW